MSDVYDEILNNSNIQTILEYYGLNIVKDKCKCPFHNDSHPSMSIHRGKNIAKCFACGAGGNAISFIQKYENEINHNSIGIKDAMKKAIEIQGLNIVIPENNVQLTEEQKNAKRLSDILKSAIQISESNLTLNNMDSAKCMEYLKSRKLSVETIKSFHIGFDLYNNTLTNKLLEKYKLEDLIKLGIVKDINNEYIDVFSNRITIPIFDENGNPVGFGARTLNDSVKPKYINTKETSIFKKSEILFNYHKAKSYAKNDELIIVEGYMDVISSKEMKMDNVVGSMGTAITKEHIDLIKKLNCEVTLCLDNDDAGRDAMIRIIPELLKAKLKVNVLDISQLGNYKDFGDLQMANMTRENIYPTKISAFTFLLKYKYIKDSKLNVENIHNIYNKMCKDHLIKDSKDVLIFKEYFTNNTSFTDEEIDNIINPKEINTETRVDRYKDVFFYQYIISLIKNYAVKHEDRILLKYIELGKLNNNNTLLETLDNAEFLKDDEITINIGGYIRDVILKSEDYISFRNDKIFILDKLLENAKAFNSEGKIVCVSLSLEQKEKIIKQYNESFDTSIKEYIENNPNEFEDLFIANNSSQFEKLFPKTYIESLKEQSVNRFKQETTMEAVRYALAYSEDMKSAMSSQYVSNDKYKTLLVFNNTNNILNLSADNIKEISKEETKDIDKSLENKEKEIIEKTANKTVESKSPMSVYIKLFGNETETYKGIYLPTEEGTQVYIPKQLYRKSDNKLEILTNNSNKAIMSEYSVNEKQKTRTWSARLSLEEFYKKYFKMYEIQMEKEVMA